MDSNNETTMSSFSLVSIGTTHMEGHSKRHSNKPLLMIDSNNETTMSSFSLVSIGTTYMEGHSKRPSNKPLLQLDNPMRHLKLEETILFNLLLSSHCGSGFWLHIRILNLVPNLKSK
jgi:hypothetical protein